MHIFSKCVRFMGESAGYWPEMAHWKAFLLALSCTRASWGAYYMCLLFSLDFLEVSNGEKFTCAHLMDSVAFVRGYLRFARFSTLMSANWPLMSVNVFFVDYGGLWSLMACCARCG